MGQLRLLAGRQPIDEVLKRKDLPPGWRHKLRLVLLAREFAFEDIGMRRTASYTLLYDTQGEPVAFNLSAAPPFELRAETWYFPIVGRVPYLGFFRRKSALERQAALRERGLETYLRPVSAFSSLGYFADPILSTMLDGPVDRLVELIFHESTHTTLFLSNRVDFNESFAVFVGQRATIDFLMAVYGNDSVHVQRARRRFSRQSKIAATIHRLGHKLRTLYRQDIGPDQKRKGRRRLFAAAKQAFLRGGGTPRASFLKRKLNNAVILSYGRYLRGLGFHEKAFRCAGSSLRTMVALYRRAAELSEDPVHAIARRCSLNIPDGKDRRRSRASIFRQP